MTSNKEYGKLLVHQAALREILKELVNSITVSQKNSLKKSLQKIVNSKGYDADYLNYVENFLEEI